MSKKIYRILDKSNGTYISMVAGMMRSEKYTKVDSAYVYNKQQATEIMKIANRAQQAMLKHKNLPKELRDALNAQDLVLIEIELKDVRLSLAEVVQALEAAKAKHISQKQAFRNAQWERVRRYSNYYTYDNTTPSHKYIYMHDFF